MFAQPKYFGKYWCYGNKEVLLIKLSNQFIDPANWDLVCFHTYSKCFYQDKSVLLCRCRAVLVYLGLIHALFQTKTWDAWLLLWWFNTDIFIRIALWVITMLYIPRFYVDFISCQCSNSIVVFLIFTNKDALVKLQSMYHSPSHTWDPFY